jgi:hypothetical protein
MTRPPYNVLLLCPTASFDQMSLVKEVQAIGRMRPDAAEEQAS